MLQVCWHGSQTRFDVAKAPSPRSKSWGVKMKKIDWMDVYFILVTIIYGLWRIKVYWARFP